MKFNISRTSGYNKNKPCNGAVLVKKSNSNYQSDYWEIEINSITDLLKLVNEVDEEVIIGTCMPHNKHNYSIEIYDGHRE